MIIAGFGVFLYAHVKTANYTHWPIRAIGFSQMCVGIGSLLFHMTQTKWGQLGDEIPMILQCLALLESQRGCHWITEGKFGKPFIIFLYSFGLMGLFGYLVLNNHTLFVTVFGTLGGALALVQMSSYPEYRREGWLMAIGIGAFGFGFFPCWITERSCPERGHWVMWGHVMWHLLVGVSARYWCYFLVLNRSALLEKRAKESDGKDKFRDERLRDITLWPKDMQILRKYFGPAHAVGVERFESQKVNAGQTKITKISRIEI